MAPEAVLKYLLATNRPYSCVDVTANLRGAYNKTAVQRALDALSEAGKVRCKLYGKQKVYVAPQGEQADAAGDDVEGLEKRTQLLTKQLSEQSSVLRTAEISLKTLTSAPTNTKALEELTEARARINTHTKKLNELKSSTNVVSAEDRKKILEAHGKLMKEYRKRKTTCSQMLDAILEGYPKSKKCLIEELCLETDEMVKFVPSTR